MKEKFRYFTCKEWKNSSDCFPVLRVKGNEGQYLGPYLSGFHSNMAIQSCVFPVGKSLLSKLDEIQKSEVVLLI